MNAPEAQNVSNRRWSASATSAEPAEGGAPSPAPAGAERYHIQPLQGWNLWRFTAGSTRTGLAPSGFRPLLAPPTVTHILRLRRIPM